MGSGKSLLSRQLIHYKHDFKSGCCWKCWWLYGQHRCKTANKPLTRMVITCFAAPHDGGSAPALQHLPSLKIGLHSRSVPLQQPKATFVELIGRILPTTFGKANTFEYSNIILDWPPQRRRASPFSILADESTVLRVELCQRLRFGGNYLVRMQQLYQVLESKIRLPGTSSKNPGTRYCTTVAS